jgi:hypothetical protein
VVSSNGGAALAAAAGLRQSCANIEFGEGIAVRSICLRLSALICAYFDRKACAHAIALALTITVISQPSTSQAAGALAVGKCGVFGQAFDRPTQAAAIAAARAQCKGECKTVTMRRACVALAIDMKNPCGSYGQAVAPRISSALNAATKFCYQYGGKECVIRTWACDARG